MRMLRYIYEICKKDTKDIQTWLNSVNFLHPGWDLF